MCKAANFHVMSVSDMQNSMLRLLPSTSLFSTHKFELSAVAIPCQTSTVNRHALERSRQHYTLLRYGQLQSPLAVSFLAKPNPCESSLRIATSLLNST